MRDYEVVYIFHPMLDEAAVNEKLDRFHGLVTGAEGTEVSTVDHWGVRQLAYPVDDQSQGYYAVAQFVAEPTDLAEFERILKLDEELLRYLVVLSEGEPSTGMSILAEVHTSGEPRDDDEDDEDEEEEDEDEDESHPQDSPPEFSGGRGKRRRVEGPRIELLNYKDVRTLSRFITEQGKILPKRTTKVTARFQRQLGRAVKRARYLALLPYIQKHED